MTHSLPGQLSLAGSRRPPRVRGLPLVGSTFEVYRDPIRFLLRGQARHGPVFRFGAGPRSYVVLAGSKANSFVQEDRGELLRAEAFWQPILDELGAPHSLVGLDGPEHRRLRQAFAPHMSRAAAERRLDDIVRITKEAFEGVPTGHTLPLVDFSQRLISKQVGFLRTGRSLEREEFDALFGYLNPVFVMLGLLRLPRWLLALRGRAFRRAKRETMELAERLLAPLDGGSSDDDRYTDKVRALATDYPQLFTPGDLQMAAILPFFAGVDTVGQTLVFAIHELLRRPDIARRVRAEVDEAFADGAPTISAFRGLEALPGLVLETLRVHPTAFGMMRRAADDFEFEGHTVRRGQDVLVFTTACHFMDEHFPNADRFDIDRYRKPRLENRRPNVYLPFGRGPHACLGAAFAEVQLAATLGTILRYFDLELANPDRTYRKVLIPTPSLGPHFAIRVRGYRE